MTDYHALLLTDIVDSTQVAQRLGDDAAALLWARHDRAARDLLRVWRGHEIDKSDGMLVMFDSVADAAGYALAYHRALETADLPFKARAGLHWGLVTQRVNREVDVASGAKPFEVDGLSVATTARVMAVAQGGQTLLTRDAHDGLGSAAIRARSHGFWQLKGLLEPIELFEVGDDASPFLPPPDAPKAYRVVLQRDVWRPRREIRHSLPAERDSFIGRHEPLLTIAQKFDEGARLVSILGIGGSGKTRLALRFAMSWLGDYPGGAWFCDLSQARTIAGIHFAVAQGLELPLDATDSIVQISRAVAGRGRCLVILDNLEQVARHAEDVLGPLLARASEAQFIVTTRAVLGIPGENTLALDSLSGEDATTLFLIRAKSAKHDFRPSDEDLAAVRQLVLMLEGLPLAIELAAARVRVMPPRALMARMTERFKLLRSIGGRDSRQATLRAAFDWSWDLLTVVEKTALAQLSVFEGGFTLESAGEVLDLTGIDDLAWTPDVIQLLVDKSLVRRVSDQRFDLLESVRDYAAEHLRTAGRYVDSGPRAESAATARHYRYFAGLDERAAVADGLAETNNLVAACRHAVAHGDAKCTVNALIGAWAALRLCGPFSVALDLISAARTVTGLSSLDGTGIDAVASDAYLMLGHPVPARALIDAGLHRARIAGDTDQEARFSCLLAEAMAGQGESEDALRTFGDALVLAEAIGDDALQCRSKNGLGSLCNDLGRLDEARGHFESALRIADRIDDPRWRAGLTGNLAMLLHADGQIESARLRYGRAIELAREIGHRRWEGNSHCNLGLLHLERGDSEFARDEFELARSMARSMGHSRLECVVLCNLGIAEEKAGDFLKARKSYEDSIAMAAELHDRRSEGQFRGYLGVLLSRLGHVADGLVSIAIGERHLRDANAELSLALLLCQKADVMCGAGRYDECEACLVDAEAVAERTSTLPDSELGRALTAGRESLAIGMPTPRPRTKAEDLTNTVRE